MAIALLVYFSVSGGVTPSIGKIIGGEGRYLEEHDWQLLVSVGAYLAGSVGFGFLFDLVLRRKQGATLTSTHSQWRQAFKADRPEGTQTFVRVGVSTGEYWAGLVAHFSADLEVGGRELVLREPILRAESLAEGFVRIDGLGALILKGDNIDSIQVFYPTVSNASG